MNPRALNKRVTIQSLSQSRGGEGSVIDTWTDAFTRWASVRPVRGREPYINDQRLPELDLVVSFRYDRETSTITPKHQIIYGSRMLEIDSVVHVEEDYREIRAFCKEYV